ncbi:hypothetical protein FGG08_003921 [Glutinoglossum americanum]|uniref:Nephrocystin 3-like N-terminal domain-containing protein n=1 Tax=Glutinoglossum americanum TaxID=1670608 RepID=A0A9P8I3D9_9PEZI|nr:hypothetical protein FGG08_003921 [Glutinoglossum americanum]
MEFSFLKRPAGTPYIQKQLQITSNMMQHLCTRFKVSQAFTEMLFENQIWSGNGCFVQRDKDRVQRFDMFYRGNCGWRDRTQTYFACDFEARTATYLCVNCSEKEIERITKEDVVSRVLALDALLADECLRAWQDNINHCRKRLIEYEYHNIDLKSKAFLATATNQLHGLSSNLHRITEHLADFEERMEFLRDALGKYVKASELHPAWCDREGVDVDDSFRFLISGAQMCRRWSVNYWERVGLRINLMFHLCAQTDNQTSAALASTNVEISHLTSAISEEAQRDNSAMITLSVVAMLFLPGTFVSGLFSMVFFNYSLDSTTGHEIFTVSRNLWLFFAVTVPLTLAIFGVWDIWRRWRVRGARRGVGEVKGSRTGNGLGTGRQGSVKGSPNGGLTLPNGTGLERWAGMAESLDAAAGTAVAAAILSFLLALAFSRFNSSWGSKTPVSSPRTFRISNIPRAITESQFRDILNNLGDDSDRPGLLQLSFAPAAASAHSERSFVATATFLIPPVVDRLQSAIKRRVGDGSDSIVVDLDFFGLTPLSNPLQDPTVDVIAITGLAGHAFGSWKSRNGPNMWLRDYLPETIPGARILTYGYDTKLLVSQSNASILEFSRKFLESVKAVRCHQNALAYAAEGSLDDKAVFKSCYAVLFFGVPNRGLNQSSLTSMVKGNPNEELVNSLGESSRFLGLLHEMFYRHFTFKDSHIISIYETKETRTVLVRLNAPVCMRRILTFHLQRCPKTGEWKRTGPRVMMVPRISATHSGPNEKIDDQLPIDANHSDIVKFSDPSNPDYVIIESRIKKLVADAPTVIRRRLAGHREYSLTILNSTECLAAFPRGKLKALTKAPKLYTNKGLTEWFDSRLEYKAWVSSKSCQFLWYSREPDSSTTSMELHKVRELSNKTYVLMQDLAYFFCDPSVRLSSVSEERRLTPAFILCSIIAQILHSDHDRGNYDRFRYINPTMEEQLSPSSALAALVSLDSLFGLLIQLIDDKPDREIQIIVENIDSLSLDYCIEFLWRLRHLWEAVMEKTKVVMKVLVTSRRTEEIQEVLKNLPCIDQETEVNGWHLVFLSITLIANYLVECLTSLRLHAYNTRQTVVAEGQGDTGDWIWENPAFRDWYVAKGSTILWIQGKPGSGKSTLSKQILRKLQIDHGVKGHAEIFSESDISTRLGWTNDSKPIVQMRAERNRDMTIVAGFFYNNRGGQTETNHSQLLQSLLYQILCQDKRLFVPIRDIYRLLRDTHGNDTSWSHEDLMVVFSILSKFDEFPLRIYIIIDAMDESDEAGRLEILSLLSNFCSVDVRCVFKSVVASRPSPDVKNRLANLKDCRQIILQDENMSDIERVIDARLKPVETDLGPQSPELQYIRSYLLRHSDGVFLWVELVLRRVEEYVNSGATGDGIRERLEGFPDDLYPFYRDIIRQLEARGKCDITEAGNMIAWASCAGRPLDVQEFGDAIAISSVSGAGNLDSTVLKAKRYRNLDHLRKGIKARSGGLLEVTTPKRSSRYQQRDAGLSVSNDIVQLLHQTVKEFLLVEESAGPFNAAVVRGDTVIANGCIKYITLSLSRASFPGGAIQELKDWKLADYEFFVRHLEDRPLLSYALSYLPHHLKSRGTQEAEGILLKFLRQIHEDPQSCSWCFLAVWFAYHGYVSLPDQQLDYARSFINTILVTAAKHGLVGVAKLAIEAKASVDCFDERNGSSPLVVAAERGRREVAEILIDNGADLDLSLEKRGTALHAAIAAGDITMVKLLLTRGASTGARGSGKGSALATAAATENEEIVKLLMSVGADVSARDEHGWTALHRVVNERKAAMVELLLASGVPANAVTNDGLTALHLAEVKQDEEMVMVLLEQNRIDPNIKDKDGWTPLSRAVVSGHEGIIKLLLGCERVNPNIIDRNGRTPLLSAVEVGNEAVVRLLLNHDQVNLDTKDRDSQSPLSRAADKEHEAIVRQLLAREDIDLNCDDTSYRTALHLAEAKQNQAIVKLLLDQEGINPNSRDKFGQTPLSRAAENGHEAMVQLLLDRSDTSADLEDHDGRTPLSWAAENGHEAVIQLLLDMGDRSADLEDYDGRTPLSWAAERGHEMVIRLLFGWSRMVFDLRDIDGQTALSRAAGNGHEAAVRLLLELGDEENDPATRDVNKDVALYHAASSGCDAVVRLLLEMGADPSAQGEDGLPVLHTAIMGGHIGAVQILLENGANPDDEGLGGWTALHVAASEGYEAAARLLLQNGADPMIRSEGGSTALHLAALEGAEAVVRLLLDKTPYVDVKNRYGWTVLHMAVEAGHGVVVQLLLDKGAYVHAQDGGGWTPLHVAVHGGHEAVVRRLLDSEADPEVLITARLTALHRAALDGHANIVRLLLDEGADSDGRSGELDALYMAAGKGHDEVVGLLLEKNPYPYSEEERWLDTLMLALGEGHGAVARLMLDYQRRPLSSHHLQIALHQAAQGGHEGVVRLLLDTGAQVKGLDAWGSTALDKAAERGHEATVRLLLEKGAVPNARSETLFRAAMSGNEIVVGLLLDGGADPNARDNDGMTVLYSASRRGHGAVAQLLLERGANPVLGPQGDGYWSFLHWGTSRGQEAIVRLLLNKGVDVNAQNEDGQTALHEAVHRCYLGIAQLLLANGADAKVRDKVGWTALHYVEHEAMVSLLIEKGAHPNAQNANGWTALHFSAYGGRKQLVQMLLQKGADQNVQDEYGSTALHLAVWEGHKDVVQLLLENGVDPNVRDKGALRLVALHLAASKGHKQIVELLLENGADPSVQDGDGLVALTLAAREGNEQIIQLLLKKGVDLNVKDDNGSVALHFATWGGHTRVVQLLLENGADPNVQDRGELVALHLAASKGNKQVVRLLLESEADPNIQDGNGSPALHIAVRGDYEQIIQLLLEAGADQGIRDGGGLAALSVAAQIGNADVVQLLLENGADPNAQNDDGSVALHLAASKGHKQAIQLLLKNGADPNARDSKGSVALHFLAWEGYKQVILFLFQNGADPNAQNNDGSVALHFAVSQGHNRVVQLLLENGANPNVRDKDGIAALHIAAWEGDQKVVQILLKSGADPKAQDKNRWTVLRHAVRGGDEAVVRLLLENEASVPKVQLNDEWAVPQGRACCCVGAVRPPLSNEADPSSQGGNVETVLHLAASCGIGNVVSLLLEYGADVMARDPGGQTALHKAAEWGQVTAAELLLGTELNGSPQDNWAVRALNVGALDNRDATPLHLATKAGHIDTVRLLLSAGADTRALDDRKATPLHWAADGASIEIVRLILAETGSDIEAKDSDGLTAIHWAVLRGEKATIRLLIGAMKRTKRERRCKALVLYKDPTKIHPKLAPVTNFERPSRRRSWDSVEGWLDSSRSDIWEEEEVGFMSDIQEEEEDDCMSDVREEEGVSFLSDIQEEEEEDCMSDVREEETN